MVGSSSLSVPCCAAALCWLVAARPALADRPDLPPGQRTFRVFDGADGLRNLVVGSLAQDDDGLLWLGTQDGVYRFDGEQFTHFSVDDGLASSLVYAVGTAPDGRVCAGGNSGLSCWNGARFSRQAVLGMPAIPVHTLVSYGGRLWVGTSGGGLYVQGADGRYAPAPGWPGPATTAVHALWADGRGLVVGNGTTVELSGGDGVWHRIGSDAGLGRDAIEGVLRDREGALWIRTSAHLWYLPVGAARATDLRDGLPTGFDAVGAPNAMAIGSHGDVLIGTDDGVTYRAGDRWRTIGRAAGMPAATTRALLVDRDGDLWIGSAGLFQLRGRGLIEHHTPASGLPGEIVWTYRRDRDGTLLAGTNRCLARAADGRWACVPGTEHRVVRALVFAPQGGMFLGGAPSDLLYIDRDGRAISLGDRDRPDRFIFALALGPEGDLWIGTRGGLYRLPGAVPGPLQPVAVPGIGSARFGSFAVVGDRLWMTADPGGVVVLDHGAPRGGERASWRVLDQAAGLRSASASYLIARSDGRLCTAYSEALGATCFGYDGGRAVGVTHIGAADGLTSGMVYFLGEDRERRLWIGTGDGVNVVGPGGPDHFDKSDGLAGNDSASQAFFLDRDGSLWLGSTGGGSHVLAQHYTGAPPAPRTVLLDGRLGDLPIHGAPPELLEVAHDRGALLIEVAAGTLLDPRRVEYQARLLPVETEWGAIHQRSARYPGLLPGSYRFEVRARVDAGTWGSTTALVFAVLPAWWQTRWFLALIVCAGLGAVGGAFALRQRSVLRRRTRQLHAEIDASFRAVIDLMPDLITLQRDGKVIYLNRTVRRLLGIAAEDSGAETDLIERVHPDDRAKVIDLFRKVAELELGMVSDVYEVQLRSADGSWRTCEVSGIRVELGGKVTVVSSGRDVTDRRRMRAKLVMSDRMASLGTLAAGIAHEINNPLAYVIGNLESMAEILGGADRTASSGERTELGAQVRDARDGAERVRKIVHGLRSFSRSEAEVRVPLALPDVLEAAIRLTGNEVRHRAELVRELGPVPLVVADDGRLTQVFINLLVNAAHAIPAGRSSDNRITVRTRTDDHGRAVIEIEDTGTGIPAELHTRVFDPFFTTKGVGEGTGLGLSICHGIVSGLGGQISIERSETRNPDSGGAPGRGTVVRVVLPPAPDQPAVRPPTTAEVEAELTARRRKRIMLVDDEPLVAHSIERLLRRDYDVTIACCGQEAIDHIVRGVRFDAIVSDVMMPNMTGIELLEELQRMVPDQAQRLVFLSGGAFTAQTRERLDQLGAPQLEKPVTAKELRACLVKIVRDAGSPAP
ncbi:MAG TPA: two-component regulator propeller domain-containing protein [Kofleriaceae bacterium]|nr:two-component regulator propeller domain-containing protein [Kofleriaceae bacterium]